jgi:transcriptional pleiotropic regulator of transition state genes
MDETERFPCNNLFSDFSEHRAKPALGPWLRKGETIMKSTGIVRRIDDLGRVVLPMELRRTLGIKERDALEVYVEGPTIVLKKYEPACIFCGDARNVVHYRGHNICRKCLNEMKTLDT